MQRIVDGKLTSSDAQSLSSVVSLQFTDKREKVEGGRRRLFPQIVYGHRIQSDARVEATRNNSHRRPSYKREREKEKESSTKSNTWKEMLTYSAQPPNPTLSYPLPTKKWRNTTTTKTKKKERKTRNCTRKNECKRKWDEEEVLQISQHWNKTKLLLLLLVLCWHFCGSISSVSTTILTRLSLTSMGVCMCVCVCVHSHLLSNWRILHWHSRQQMKSSHKKMN